MTAMLDPPIFAASASRSHRHVRARVTGALIEDD